MSGLGEYHNDYGGGEEEYPHRPTDEELARYQEPTVFDQNDPYFTQLIWFGSQAVEGGLTQAEIDALTGVWHDNPEVTENLEILKPE